MDIIGQRTADSGQREKWLTEAIAELEEVVRSKRLLSDDAVKRITRDYQDELKALKDKANKGR